MEEISTAEVSLITRFFEARSMAGITQAELAARLGMHQTTVGRFELGELIPTPRRTKMWINALVAEIEHKEASLMSAKRTASELQEEVGQ